MHPNTRFSGLIITKYKPVREQLKYLHPIHALSRMPETRASKGLLGRKILTLTYFKMYVA